jgi:hypothetical protein
MSATVAATTPAVRPGTILEDFDDGVADGWELATAAVRTARLELGNWSGDTRALCTATTLAPAFTLQATVRHFGGAPANVGRILVRYHDERTWTAIEFGGGEGPIHLRQSRDGRQSTLASASGWKADRFTLVQAADGALGLTLHHDGVERPVFTAVPTTTPAGGRLGFSTTFTTMHVDDVRVIPQ